MIGGTEANWGAVSGRAPQGSVLCAVLFYIFFYGMLRQSAPSAGGISLGGVAGTAEGRAAIQRDLEAALSSLLLG